MSIWIDRKYILLLSPKLELFKQKNTNLYTFRCPYCGDSQRIKSKTRGFVYAKKDNYFYTCFNCEKGTTLRSLISFLDSHLEQEYVMENFKEKYTNNRVRTVEPSIPKFKSIPEKQKIDLPTIQSLDDNHTAKKYIIDRKIPESAFKRLYYAEDFKAFVESVSDKQLDQTGPRVIIPFYARDGSLIAFQGRALDDYSMRYITVKLDRDKEKLFGLDTVNPKKPIFVVEGPFDSLFLPNAVATADSNLAAASKVFDKDNLILVPDNEPRNKSIVSNIGKFIKSGFSVCLLPSSFTYKDINEAVKNGLTKEEILGIINNNTFSGLTAEIEFINWKKI